MGPARQAALPRGAAWPHGEPGGRVHRGTPQPGPALPRCLSPGCAPARGSGQHSPALFPAHGASCSVPLPGARHLCGRGLRDSRAPGGLFSRGRQGTGRAPTARPPCSQEADRLPAGSGAQTARPGPLPARPSPTHEAKAAALHAPCSSSFTPNAARTAQRGAGTAHTHHSTRPARGWVSQGAVREEAAAAGQAEPAGLGLVGTGRSAQDPQADIPRDPQWGAGTSSCCSHDVRGRRAGACAGPTLALECSRPPARALWTPRGSAPVPEPRQKPLPPGPYAQHPEPQRTQRVGVQTQQSRGGGCEGHSTELGAPDGDAIPDTGRPAGGRLGPPPHGPSHRGSQGHREARLSLRPQTAPPGPREPACPSP